MNQAVRTLSRFEPVSTPAPLSHLIATRKGCLVEAVRYLPHEDDPRAVLGENWIIHERDEAKGVLRESTDLYASAEQAYDSYWSTDPMEFAWEAWVSPLFATSEAA